MSKYTPRPWNMYKTPNDPDFVAEIEGIASVYAVSGDALANARLIAAAPESHEANKLSLMVMCAIRAAGILSHESNFARQLDGAIEANRAAIAKATGEQQ